MDTSDMSRTATAKRKRIVLKTLSKTFGNITTSCETAHVSRTTFYKWIREDLIFKEKYESVDYDESKIDFVEGKLIENIKDNKEASIIFFLKTKGRKRGYQENMDVSVKGRVQELVSKPLTPEEMKAFNDALESEI